MEEILKSLQNIQSNLSQHKQEMKDMEKNIKDAINKNIDDKFNQILLKTNQLEQKIINQEKTIEYLDKKLRAKNVIFFGVPEDEKNYEDLSNLIMEIINNKMKITCSKWEIDIVKRLGKKEDGKVRPVLLTTTTTNLKLELIRNKAIQNFGIYVKEDYPPRVLQIRRELQGELKRRRQSGENVILRYDKIITLNSYKQKKDISEKNNSNKRLLSESPETPSSKPVRKNDERAKQASKKNKSQNITDYLRQSQLNTTSNPPIQRDSQESSKN